MGGEVIKDGLVDIGGKIETFSLVP